MVTAGIRGETKTRDANATKRCASASGTHLHRQDGNGLRQSLVRIVDQNRSLFSKLQKHDRHHAAVALHPQALDPEFPARCVKTKKSKTVSLLTHKRGQLC